MKSSRLAFNLKRLRKEQGISQKYLSEKLNISRQALSYYECGTREPDLSTLINISNYFNCSIDSLFNESDKMSSKEIKNLLEKKSFSKKDLICSLKNKKKSFERSIKEIDFMIDILNNNNYECANELSIIDNINNINNTVDLDFYKKNKIKIFNTSKVKNVYQVPKVGYISAGEPILAEQNIEEYFPLSKDFLNYPYNEYFILQVNGESMNKIYKDKDLILCKICNEIIPNRPLVALVDQECATIKYIEKDTSKNTFSLVPKSTLNNYKTKTYSFNEHTLSILGVAIGVIKQEN